MTGKLGKKKAEQGVESLSLWIPLRTLKNTKMDLLIYWKYFLGTDGY